MSFPNTSHCKRTTRSIHPLKENGNKISERFNILDKCSLVLYSLEAFVEIVLLFLVSLLFYFFIGNVLPSYRWNWFLEHFVCYRLGGPDPLDYISMYANPGVPHENIPPHWHYIR